MNNALIISMVFQVIFLIHSIESKKVFYKSNSIHSRTGEIDTVELKPGYYNLTMSGSRGGSFNDNKFLGGFGITIRAIMNVTKITKLKLVIGKPGADAQTQGLPGGGGGSFVYLENKSLVADNDGLLIATGGGGGGCTIKTYKGQNATIDQYGKNATVGFECTGGNKCIGKGGVKGNYGTFPSSGCSVCGKGVGGLGGSWKGSIPKMSNDILADRSGKSGHGPNSKTPFVGGTGFLAGGFGGGGGGGSGQDDDGPSGGSGAGGGYSGGGVGYSKGSCGGGGGSYARESKNSIISLKVLNSEINLAGNGFIEIMLNNAVQPQYLLSIIGFIMNYFLLWMFNR